ncbi:MAG: 4-hydroxy-3-methylbut-2-enyl diphosphate reductase [Candidatus Cloacimonetes bacterium]|jgi:(E)-4-hydroxy-3-methyl-but-2-enyl pyrophosphate reductase|nr:4-hydroxy-3-methylbut-2-enyl diphosphate reductase [Candidatus Cloacimonadota bacterium]MDY0338112.1 4-hydroxy-3-methylbut-2-enyl diphosphate reductase [Candidatus Cloacimonadaceae bacterium]MCB5269623.1 4-hydroxy-3-methylbut-2-enyl diphosphate reductase [Candidatus Cloacimonadota bacterium]MDD2543151.1 4-hydroxy-3-methylbut-2-enyl diphosphate reductase [Candidatus Cloacimonadota bacterium]MDD3097571.1 4-hydroxy-3-methylbut-2-enyl diphosphate reductase [Candidatus Cloacimonadota bacterium]
MLIRLAKYSGYCFGVRRAIQLAMDAAQSVKPVYSLGELIHNPQVVKELHARGILVADQATDLHGATVVIRSHGISKEMLNSLQEQGSTIIDATCPYVKRTHELICKANEDGYPVLILGDPHHPEVSGLHSYGNTNTIVYEPGSPLPQISSSKLCVISQTTQKLENLQQLVSKLLPNVTELKVYNTICLATSQRQSASECLARESDLMIVIGGRNSSNTKMLASMCSKYCDTIHIETEAELVPEQILGSQRIGLAAGASTPESRIISVYNKLLKINGDAMPVQSLASIPLFKEESC